MALKYSQYIGGTKVDVTADSGAVPNTTKHKVSVLTSGSYETKRPNFIAKIKCVDTEAQWTNVDIYDIHPATPNRSSQQPRHGTEVRWCLLLNVYFSFVSQMLIWICY